jgi:hypothetical protein
MSMNYKGYIQSPQWATKAFECRAAAGGKCEICGSERELATHHYNYRRLGCEDPVDIFCLCRECHETYHRKLNGHPPPEEHTTRSERFDHLKAVISGPKWPLMSYYGAKTYIWRGSRALRDPNY